MDSSRRLCQKWRCTDRIILVTLHILLLVSTSKCETIHKDESNFRESYTKNNTVLDNNVESSSCHSCQSKGETNVVTNVLNTVNKLPEKYVFNNTERALKELLENTLDEVLNKDNFELVDGVEIKVDKKNTSIAEDAKARALFSSYTFEYRLLQKIKNFFNTHIMSINLPKATGLINFRSFGLKKLFWPLLIGFQIFKSILLAMFLPSILGSFGKILGKGLSQLSAASSQASYPPANGEEPTSYNDNKDFMGYETNQAEAYLYAQDGNSYGNMDGAEANDLSSLDVTRFGASGQKVSYLPSKNNYYKNQMAQVANNYKNFQKIPASSMILSNYDPFYSPLLSRLDGIFARLGLAPVDGATDNGQQIGGQSLSTVKLEACREQLICLMYSSPAKYAPYSNLVSAQLSRELNELRRPVSDNPEILRFFRYMRAARQGQEGINCTEAHAACSATTSPSHTMIAAYQDINKLVTARKL